MFFLPGSVLHGIDLCSKMTDNPPQGENLNLTSIYMSACYSLNIMYRKYEHTSTIKHVFMRCDRSQGKCWVSVITAIGGREVLRCMSAAGYMVHVWTAVCTASHCVVPRPRWFKWYAMHYWWRRKCTLTHWSWGARALFSAGGRRKEQSAMVCHGGGTWPLIYLPLTLFPCSHLIVYKRIWSFFFFFKHMMNWVRLP